MLHFQESVASQWKLFKTIAIQSLKVFVSEMSKWLCEIGVSHSFCSSSWIYPHSNVLLAKKHKEACKSTVSRHVCFLQAFKCRPWALLKLSCDEGLAEGHDESQSTAGSCFLPGESECVSCFLAGTGSGGVNRGNPTCWWGNSAVPSYTHPAGTTMAVSVLSLPLSPALARYTHTYRTHMEALLPT